MRTLKKLVALALALLLTLGVVAVGSAEAAEKVVTLATPTAWTTVNPFLSMDGSTNFIHGMFGSRCSTTTARARSLPWPLKAMRSTRRRTSTPSICARPTSPTASR